MRALRLGLLVAALCLAPIAAWAGNAYNSTVSLANGATLTTGTANCRNATIVSFSCGFTASATGGATLVLDVSWDGGTTWYPYQSQLLTNTTGANTKAFAAIVISGPVCVPAPDARARFINSTGAAVTFAGVSVIAN